MIKSKWIRTGMLLAGGATLMAYGCGNAWWHVLYIGVPLGLGWYWGSLVSPV